MRAVSFAARNGNATAAPSSSRAFSDSTVLRSMSGNGVGTCLLTTRIISSGEMPLAVIAATKLPALVPT